MTLSETIFAAVTGWPSFRGAAGTRLYPVVAEEGGATPFAVYSIVGSSDEPTHDDDTDDLATTLQRTVVQFSVYAATWREASALSLAVQTALQQVQSTGTGLRVALESGPRFFPESTTRLRRVDVDLALSHHLAL